MVPGIHWWLPLRLILLISLFKWTWSTLSNGSSGFKSPAATRRTRWIATLLFLISIHQLIEFGIELLILPRNDFLEWAGWCAQINMMLMRAVWPILWPLGFFAWEPVTDHSATRKGMLLLASFIGLICAAQFLCSVYQHQQQHHHPTALGWSPGLENHWVAVYPYDPPQVVLPRLFYRLRLQVPRYYGLLYCSAILISLLFTSFASRRWMMLTFGWITLCIQGGSDSLQSFPFLATFLGYCLYRPLSHVAKPAPKRLKSSW